MRKDLAKKLEDQFPFMKRNPENEHNLYDKFGICAAAGWFDIIWNLCSEVTEVYEKAGKEIDFVPAQIKEKFGTLRFYYDVGGVTKPFHAFDILGAGTIRFDDESTELYREIRDIVRKWEKKSAETCEECGKPGVLRKDLRWVLTLCDECYEKQGRK